LEVAGRLTDLLILLITRRPSLGFVCSYSVERSGGRNSHSFSKTGARSTAEQGR